ncbi:MAG: bifunctional hydroxymethylpyrimidine kinase/phosphomethylpyrimidine kinase [Pseudomonadota bacterium]
MIPNILSIAGSDPSGGAGIQADLKAISASGGFGMAAITALTAQNTCGVTGVHLVPAAFVVAQIEAILEDIDVAAIKIGMLGTAEIVEAVAGALPDAGPPLVVDPVMVAKGGDRLLEASAVDALRTDLIPRATVITPNLPEAADLAGRPTPQDRIEMEELANTLLDLGPKMVVLKGGHLGGPESPDLVATATTRHWLDGARVTTKNTHGTGCSLSSALATFLALTPEDPIGAATRAKTFVARSIAKAHELSVGRGHGPIHHFHALVASEEP